MNDILSRLGSDPATAKRVSYQRKGADWFEVTQRGSATATRKLGAAEVARLNPIEGA